MSEKGSIYIMRNSINDMVYIGQTVDTIESRMFQHFQQAHSKRTTKARFQEAILEIGWQNFYIEELEANICRSKLREREFYWFGQYDKDLLYNNNSPMQCKKMSPHQLEKERYAKFKGVEFNGSMSISSINFQYAMKELKKYHGIEMSAREINKLIQSFDIVSASNHRVKIKSHQAFNKNFKECTGYSIENNGKDKNFIRYRVHFEEK
ncbi:MAG: GIY-YIG nuclease family protein [Phocaeicola sp.]